MKRIKTMRSLVYILGAFLLKGCDVDKVLEPPLAVTFRQGVLSSHVLQVNNLSTENGVEIYVYVASRESSTRSGNVVVPANSAKEFGALEMKWEFKAGDKGFVRPVKYAQKLFFEVSANGQYRTWFGFDDIKEVDVAAKVRAEKAAKREAMLKEKVGLLSVQGKLLFDAIVQTNIVRMSENLGPLWPKSRGTLKERAKDRLLDWKAKVERKLKNENPGRELKKDISTKKFGFAFEYFNALFDVSEFGTDRYAPYISEDLMICALDVKDKGSRSARIITESVKWSVIADMKDEMSGNIPVLITSNFPCEKLRSCWDGTESADEVIALAKSGDLKGEAFVVVYKSGDVKAFMSTQATLTHIYSTSFNTCTNGYNHSVRYLTSDGVVNAVGVAK